MSPHHSDQMSQVSWVTLMMLMIMIMIMLNMNFKIQIIINLLQFEGQNNTILRARSGENVTLDCVVFLRQDTTVTIFVFVFVFGENVIVFLCHKTTVIYRLHMTRLCKYFMTTNIMMANILTMTMATQCI